MGNLHTRSAARPSGFVAAPFVLIVSWSYREDRTRCVEHHGNGTGSGGTGSGGGVGTKTNGSSAAASPPQPSSTAITTPTESTTTVRPAEVDPKVQESNLSVYEYDADVLRPDKYYSKNVDNPIVLFAMTYGTTYEINPEEDDDFKTFLGNDASKSYIYGK